MINIKHGHRLLIHGSSVFIWLHIGLAATAARPICAKKHRLAMYQKAVTMFYLHITFSQKCSIMQGAIPKILIYE